MIADEICQVNEFTVLLVARWHSDDAKPVRGLSELGNPNGLEKAHNRAMGRMTHDLSGYARKQPTRRA